MQTGATPGQTVTSLCLMLTLQHEKRYFDKHPSVKTFDKNLSPKIAKKPLFCYSENIIKIVSNFFTVE